MTQFENVKVTPETGRRLQLARKQKQLSRQELADRINASETQIEKYEHGTLDMAMSRLFEIAAVLEVTAAELLVDSAD